MKKKSKLTIITLLIVIICLLFACTIYKYYNVVVNKETIPSNVVDNQDNKPSSNYSSASVDRNNTDNEISLGDVTIDNCNTEETRYKNGSWACGSPPDNSYNKAGGGGSTECKDNYGLTCSTCYQTKISYKYCTKCNNGYKVNDDGSCTQCSANYYGNNGTSCTACSAGTKSNAGSDESSDCTTCAAGTYGSSAGSGCTTCPANKKCTGGTNIADCPAGKESAAGSSDCTACAAGKYGSSAGGGCSTCPANKYCTGGTSIANCPAGTEGPNGGLTSSSSCTACSDGYISSAGSACTACGTGKTSNKSHTKCCDTPKEGYYRDEDCNEVMYPVTGVDSSSTIYIDPSEIGILNINAYQAKNTDIGTKVIVNSWKQEQSTANAFTFESSGNRAISKSTGKLLIDKGGSCQPNTITVTAENDQGSASAKHNVCVYCQDLDANKHSGAWKTNARPSRSSAHGTAGCVFYDGLDTGDDGQQFYRNAYSRCCGTKPPPSDYGACYGTEPYISALDKNDPTDKVAWFAKKGDIPSSWGKLGRDYYKYPASVAANSAQCVMLEKPKGCEEGNLVANTKDEYAKVCEDEVEFKIPNTLAKCGYGLDTFYSIDCERVVKTKFDYLDDGDNNSNNLLARGLGYRFGIDVSTDLSCESKFNSNVWVDSYRIALENLRKVVPYNINIINAKEKYIAIKTTTYNKEVRISVAEQKARDYFQSYIMELKEAERRVDIGFTDYTERRLYELYRDATNIENIVIRYNEIELGDESYEEKAKLFMEYQLIGNNSNTAYNYEFDSKLNKYEIKKNSGITHVAVTNLAPWLNAPSNYTLNSERKIELNPKKVYVEKTPEAKITSNNRNSLDGGNKIYIDYNAKDQTIPIKIIVSDLAGNKSTVTNDKCSVVINSRDILYRPIDVSNPFINNSWKPGVNWINSQFDFRNIIHTNG